jgi:dihydrofolate reductase
MELRIVTGLEVLERHGLTENAWLCGGASIYEQFLPRCSDLYLSVVKREVAGDALFPQFEHLFTLREIVLEHPEFEVRHYVRNPA